MEKPRIRPSLQFLATLFAIGVLWLIFMGPGWNCNSKDSARRTACLSNVKGLAYAQLTYAADYDDRLPIASRWMDSLERYMKDGGTVSPVQAALLYQVDDNLKPPPKVRDVQDPMFVSRMPSCPTLVGEGKPRGFGYAMNIALSGKRETESPTTPLVFESSDLARNVSGTLADLPNPPRHGHQNVIAYEDAHAKAVSFTQK